MSLLQLLLVLKRYPYICYANRIEYRMIGLHFLCVSCVNTIRILINNVKVSLFLTLVLQSLTKYVMCSSINFDLCTCWTKMFSKTFILMIYSLSLTISLKGIIIMLIIIYDWSWLKQLFGNDTFQLEFVSLNYPNLKIFFLLTAYSANSNFW